MVNESIKSLKAFDKMLDLVRSQDGDIGYLFDLNKFHKAKNIIEIKSDIEGYIDGIDAYTVGKVACNLGAGRKRLGDRVDYSVGIELLKKRGEYVNKGDVLFRLHSNYDDNHEYIKDLLKAYSYTKEKKEHKLVLDTIM